MTELPIVVNMTVDASRTEYDLTAESNLEEIELLNDTVIETGGSHVPVYEGPYTVDAGLNAVTLDTDGKRMTQDVTVNALTENYISGNEITVNSSGRVSSFVSVSAGYSPNVFAQMFYKQLDTQARATITPTASEQTAVARGKYTTGAVKVRAIPAGTAGTPTATKGTVSNHSVSVTPSVTNTTGYIEGGTINGTAVSVSASELVSGNKAITRNGNNIDVANYSTVSVNVPTVTPTGEISITQNGTYDVTDYASAVVNVSGGNPADQYVTAQSIQFQTSNIPTDFYAYYPKATSFRSAFYNVTLTNQNSITIKSDSEVKSMASFMNSRSINPDCIVTLDMDLSKCTSYNAAFGPRISTDKAPRVIVANLDFSSVTSATNANAFNGNQYVTTLTFVPNTLKVNFPISSASGLTNATLVSLANCLVAGSHTLTLHATPKTNLSTIMGTVTNNGTYDVFTEDAQGQTTLLSFITTTKGWTVA